MNAVPNKQLPEVGVTVYVAVDTTDRLLDSVLVTVPLLDPDEPPVMPEPSVGVPHEYVVPDGITPVGV